MSGVLITGGAGFVGSNAVAHFLAKGSRVIALDNLGLKGRTRLLNGSGASVGT